MFKSVDRELLEFLLTNKRYSIDKISEKLGCDRDTVVFSIGFHRIDTLGKTAVKIIKSKRKSQVYSDKGKAALTETFLSHEYIGKDRSAHSIAVELGVCRSMVCRYISKYKLVKKGPRPSVARSLKEVDVPPEDIHQFSLTH